jgi:hypothetical protein
MKWNHFVHDQQSKYYNTICYTVKNYAPHHRSTDIHITTYKFQFVRIPTTTWLYHGLELHSALIHTLFSLAQSIPPSEANSWMIIMIGNWMLIRGNTATRASWDSIKQRLYRYFRVLCVLYSITQSITIPFNSTEKTLFHSLTQLQFRVYCKL